MSLGSKKELLKNDFPGVVQSSHLITDVRTETCPGDKNKLI
jgi:hypothetical protein